MQAIRLLFGDQAEDNIPLAAGKDIPGSEIDGVLPTALFRSAFISFSDRFAVLKPL
jgi:hypothetical protein